VAGTYEYGGVFDGSLYLKSRALVSQLASIACCKFSISVSLSLSLCAPPDTSCRHGRRRPDIVRFCTFQVTCPCEPVTFSRLLRAPCLYARHLPSILQANVGNICWAQSLSSYIYSTDVFLTTSRRLLPWPCRGRTYQVVTKEDNLLAAPPESSDGRVRSYSQPASSPPWLSMLTYYPGDEQ
jgi:hypothetical protein